MNRLTLLLPRNAAKILGISYPTLKQWVYKKLQTVQTAGGHHRIPESGQQITSTVTAGAVREMRLKTGDTLGALMESTEAMLVRS